MKKRILTFSGFVHIYEDYYGVPAKADTAIGPPAKHINIVSEPIPMPMVSGGQSGKNEKKPDDTPLEGREQPQA